MTFELHELTVNNSSVLNRLQSYLDKISNYSYFDTTMQLRVFVDSNKDFTIFEGVKYNLDFVSSSHKLMETIKSCYKPLIVDFLTFKQHIDNLLRDK